MSYPEDVFRYIPRAAEQHRIFEEAAKVRETGKSRAVLLYGRGGTGKTRLLRRLPDFSRDPEIVCLPPIDVDDSQHWLLSNLERYVADKLDPEKNYFQPFIDYVDALPRHGLTPTSREAVLSHLNAIKETFVQCYSSYLKETGKSVVITFDTIEAIRGMYLLRALTRWIKGLPGTLFILAGRSADDDPQDPVRAGLEEPPLSMEVSTIRLGHFSLQDGLEYLASLGKMVKLPEGGAEKLVYLAQGNPLWLALAVDYVATQDMPKATQDSLDDIKRDLPYHDDPTTAGRERVESFKSQLMAPYKAMDFWHVSIKRLAVVRESISQPIWEVLMADRPLPAGVADFSQAWHTLGEREWIRHRANRRYVTLHDAVAEELAHRVITFHDFSMDERRALWRSAARLYEDQASKLELLLNAEQPAVDERLRELDAWKQNHDPAQEAPADEARLIRDVARLDNHRQELHQLEAARLVYEILSDHSAGARLFVRLMRGAMSRHEVLFEDLLAFQMQRFLPGGTDENAVADTVAAAAAQVRKWLSDEGRECYIDVGLEMADYLFHREQHAAALRLLGQLPVPADHKRRYRLCNLQADASLRIPGQVRESGEYFDEALAEARKMPPPDRDRYIADAYKELGFYYRNIGHWENADEAYQEARDAISRVPSSEESDSDLAQKASIYTNWAYLKGIGGKYDEGINFVETAITLRRKLGMRHGQAISLSVKGEVLRYHRQFKEAWDAYVEAEALFQELNSWSWLGAIYQEQAICLIQAIPAKVQLLEPQQTIQRAESLILRSLELCSELNVRAYPAALNRAGRIFGEQNPDRGLKYLEEGAARAEEISDGWFWMANLIEYAELCYRAWDKTGEPRYREKISDIGGKLLKAQRHLEFQELMGRWYLLQAHLAVRDGLAMKNEGKLNEALREYMRGFPLIMHGWVGSYGASTAIPEEFRKFSALAAQLPPEIRATWKEELRRSWSEQDESTIQLIARLEEL
jgi:hypothetical protein